MTNNNRNNHTTKGTTLHGRFDLLLKRTPPALEHEQL